MRSIHNRRINETTAEGGAMSALHIVGYRSLGCVTAVAHARGRITRRGAGGPDLYGIVVPGVRIGPGPLLLRRVRSQSQRQHEQRRVSLGQGQWRCALVGDLRIRPRSPRDAGDLLHRAGSRPYRSCWQRLVRDAIDVGHRRSDAGIRRARNGSAAVRTLRRHMLASTNGGQRSVLHLVNRPGRALKARVRGRRAKALADRVRRADEQWSKPAH